MKLNNYSLFSLLFLFLSANLFSQDTLKSRSYPRDFRPPLDLSPALAGSFGEIRSNHFHSGLDYRTNQREGYPVYAVADGYISRLRIQIGGFGNAVYISHPSGYTSVYAHLQRFNTRISQTIKDYQYRRESYDVDFPLIPIEIPVKKGDIIAWSGNTGSSGGPHLHFELRDSKTEETINPQLFGFTIPDNVKPIVTGLYMYRLDNKPFSDNTPAQYFQIQGSNGNYTLNQNPVVKFNGSIGFGISTYDQQIAGGNKNGVYSIQMLLDNKVIFTSVLERFSFDNSRAINSHIDYPGLIKIGRTVQKSFIEPGNPLKIYGENVDRGLISISDDSIHQMKYIVKDFKGNTSFINFKIQRSAGSLISRNDIPGVKEIKHATQNEFSNGRIKVAIPPGVLYDDIELRYSTAKTPAGSYSVLHKVHSRLTPLHSGFKVSIKPDQAIPVHFIDKAVIVDTRGAYHGGAFVDGFVQGTPRSFGEFYIKLDTVAPLIRPINITDGKSVSSQSSISLKISDNLSGIRSYRGTIDGQWVLFEYNFKTATISHTFEKTLRTGKHHLQIVADDLKMNSRTLNIFFYK